MVNPNSSGDGYNSGLGSWQLPTGSAAKTGAIWREQDEARRSQAGSQSPTAYSTEYSSSSNSSDANGAGAGGLAVMALLAPPFVAPCYMLYETWGALSVAQWHPVFKLLAEIGEVYALFAGLWVMYKRIPQFWCALTSAIYMGLCYGGVLYWMGANDAWVCGVGLATASGGYYLGRKLHASVATSMMTMKSALRGTWLIVSALLTTVSLIILAAIWLVGGVWAVWELGSSLYMHVSGFIVFVLCCGLAAAVIYFPLRAGRWLATAEPRWLGRAVTVGLFGIVGGIFASLTGVDQIWFVAIVMTAMAGGWACYTVTSRTHLGVAPS